MLPPFLKKKSAGGNSDDKCSVELYTDPLTSDCWVWIDFMPSCQQATMLGCSTWLWRVSCFHKGHRSFLCRSSEQHRDMAVGKLWCLGNLSVFPKQATRNRNWFGVFLTQARYNPAASFSGSQSTPWGPCLWRDVNKHLFTVEDKLSAGGKPPAQLPWPTELMMPLFYAPGKEPTPCYCINSWSEVVSTACTFNALAIFMVVFMEANMYQGSHL